MTSVYSTKNQMKEIAHYLTAYMKIPFFQDDTIPGKIMEKIISLVRGGRQLGTYDYVDVCINGDVGWSVKSTKEATPLTWKRAKIPNSSALILASEKSAEACQNLGDAIVDFCNTHIAESMEIYNLKTIGYARLVMLKNNCAIYFERELRTQSNDQVFKKNDFTWKWSKQKLGNKKEQLSALHGINKTTNEKVFAWHGRGENQLHFSGEKEWWPAVVMPAKLGEVAFSSDGHAMAFILPDAKVSWDELVVFLNKSSC